MVEICTQMLFKQDWVKEDKLKIVFSGRKGFHIKVKPLHAVDDVQTVRKSLIDGVQHLIKIDLSREWPNSLGNNTVLDPFNPKTHPWLRLLGSIYSWEENGIVNKRRTFRMSLPEFRALSMQDILARAKV